MRKASPDVAATDTARRSRIAWAPTMNAAPSPWKVQRVEEPPVSVASWPVMRSTAVAVETSASSIVQRKVPAAWESTAERKALESEPM